MAEPKYSSVLLFGAPGVGKGTQGKILGCVPGFLHLSMGDVFRSLDKDSELGRIFLEHSTRGELVPDDVTIQIWSEHLRKLREAGRFEPGRQILVLDGIPRNVEQASLLDDRIEVLRVVHLTASDPDALIERLRRRALKENRPDDAKQEVVRRRLEIYRADTQPVLEHYEASLIADVDAIGAAATVLMNVLGTLAPLQDAALGNVLEKA